MKITTHGAKDKGTKGGTPKGNRGECSKPPAQNVGTGNCRKYAFPSTGGMRKGY